MKKKLKVEKPKQKPYSKENPLYGLPFDEAMKRIVRVKPSKK